LEQYLLNSIKVTSVLYQDIDPFYLRYMAVEDKYEEYASQIWAYTRRPGKQEIPIETVIKDLSKYLRFTEGYLHDSYKNFVRGIVWAADRYIHSGFGRVENKYQAGMVDPNVLKNVGYDPEIWSGFAFGMGIERIAMIRHRISDIRLLYENDVRFLEQF